MVDKDTPQEVAAKFLARLKDSPFIMIGLAGGHHVEPMNVKTDEDQPNVLFVFSGKENRIAAGGEATAQFAGKGHDFFASLMGTVSEETDHATFDKLWDNRVEAWFPNGKQDARLNRFDVSSAELWETDVSLGGRLKMLIGGTIKPQESSSHAMVDSIA
ncbi:pyridoxamine 5'-phosphate oxidase family protein [Sphingomonas bacterium]|uniref:pyridoxamine 5'-phosphate oxidase family protein n=1 Tax=Sphingomonas bacterium TaxID=1895847 RepID=UPI0015775239|nr:pyridoxamine 5'-phosphate oxidase family protein [Sphingomonas bacterium]